MNFYWQNFWITLIVLLPNLLYLRFPPKHVSSDSDRPKGWVGIIILEKIGQIAAFTLVLFWKFSINGIVEVFVFCTMIFCAVIYYICWFRYIKKGQSFKLLYDQFLGVPIPLAIAPVIYFLCAGILLHSWIYIACVLILAVGHVFESLACYKHLQ
jgi:hypothetical protein